MDNHQLWAGVDVGTQSLRVVVADDAGTVVGQGSHALASQRAGDRHEQDPAGWWHALGAAFRQALRTAPADRVAALAICGTSGTFLLAGADGTPRTPALMYDDARAAAEAEEVAAAGGDPGTPCSRPGHCPSCSGCSGTATPTCAPTSPPAPWACCTAATTWPPG
jgi:sugar (pentulose or hexulose) kinase